MNNLIELLRESGDMTLAGLKKLYRALCKKTHPDTGGGDDGGFIRLREEYEDAVVFLRARMSDIDGLSDSGIGYSTPREELMAKLYLYSLKIYSREGGALLDEMIAAAEGYDPETMEILKSYRDIWIADFENWRGDFRRFNTHNLLISAVRQMFYFFTYGKELHKRSFFRIIEDAEKRTKYMDAAMGGALLEMAGWLRREIDGERVYIKNI
ncbi:MAG: hypothetical protein A2Y33_00940 [Spirochaetes bacterium GWF1_51_8]|nr:MAG: hypothetical protein A2Y33_00940 [Spirochaetes bacterium GWF1_51_8]